MRDLSALRYDSLAIAMPGQDASPAKEVTFGINEGHVIVDGAKWLKQEFPGTKVVVVGLSMGGAAAWLASQEDPSIDGIVTDSAFARFDETMNTFFDRKLKGGRFVFAPVVWICRALSGIDPASVRPVDAARMWRGKPALVIQGDADTLVVTSHGRRLAAAAQCPLWIVHGAGHVESFGIAPKLYLQRLVGLAEKVSSGMHSEVHQHSP